MCIHIHTKKRKWSNTTGRWSATQQNTITINFQAELDSRHMCIHIHTKKRKWSNTTGRWSATQQNTITLIFRQN